MWASSTTKLWLATFWQYVSLDSVSLFHTPARFALLQAVLKASYTTSCVPISFHCWPAV